MRKVRIILGIIIILGGFGGIVSGEVLPATFCILGGISLIPAIYEKSKLNNKLLQIILPIVLLSIFGSMVSTKETASNTTVKTTKNVDIYQRFLLYIN